ncbi:hypothetical protein [Nevskia sp.]|uniref:hypothetical protein n=1 Tax=Nevskia sp. TaxID=1929292 RepID=UPI0025F9CC83|nr:hypothetical protein [Nevskia sp.]
MPDSPEQVANEMRSTLARLHARGKGVGAAHGRILDAAHHRASVVDAGMPALKSGAIATAEGLDAYANSLTERERLHRLAALPR